MGDSLRPGSIADSFDRPQIHELLVMVEGDTSPGDSPKEDNKRGTFLYFGYAPHI
ncbi:MAG: hypothetical protein ACO2O5_02465 [Candidatus Caldipriscus sp.]